MLATFSKLLIIATGVLSASNFEKVHRDLLPPADETWKTIPWKISLLEAQSVAAAEGKPLFIWAMDGHPLGCT